MLDVITLILKIVLIVLVAMYIGKKTGLFSLSPFVSALALALLACILSLELYASLLRDDISFLIVFKSSFLSFTLNLSFFIRIFTATLILGLICSVFGVKPFGRITTVKDLCVLALLIAITVLLGIYCTVRIGSGIKISFKFISVFVTGALFGPLWGGAVAAIADVINFFINPVGGAFLPQITLVEFLYGFTYGLFFYNMSSWQSIKTILKVIVCVILQTILLSLCLTSYFLMPLMKMSFKNLVVLRSVSVLITMATKLVLLSFLSKYISSFRRMLK